MVECAGAQGLALGWLSDTMEGHRRLITWCWEMARALLSDVGQGGAGRAPGPTFSEYVLVNLWPWLSRELSFKSLG